MERLPLEWRAAIPEIRATVLAGIWLGALVGGVGGRLAMLLLRVLSPDHLHGIDTDDGFAMGEVTLLGSYNLILLGAMFGVIGASAYRWVAPWLIGPGWFRHLSAALGAGAVVGGMLVHQEGLDFVVLRPLWLAIALFVLIPALFGFFIGPLERALARPGSWVDRGRRQWIVPVVSVVVFPPVAVLVAITVALRLLGASIGDTTARERIRQNLAVGVVARGAWLTIAVLGLLSLVDDARAILA